MYVGNQTPFRPNRDVLWGEVHKWESLAAKEPSRGNAAAAICARVSQIFTGRACSAARFGVGK
eukprot:scaffold108093_cov33-Phaeocystis_antarctica.AAC.1